MKLESLIEEAGTLSTPPKPSPKGIPKQRLPSWIRHIFLCFFLPFIYLELACETLARFFITPPYKQKGQCKRRGNCCYYILLPDIKGIVGKIIYFWNTEIFGFYPRFDQPMNHEGKSLHVMGCRYLGKDGSCQKYFFRPKVCRSWPVIRSFGQPRVLKGCGYHAEIRKSYAKKYSNLRVLHNNDDT